LSGTPETPRWGVPSLVAGTSGLTEVHLSEQRRRATS